MFLTSAKVRKALRRAGQEEILDDLAQEMAAVHYGADGGSGHQPVMIRACTIVAAQLGVDFADAYESVRGALQESTHHYMRDSEPVRFGAVAHDLERQLADYYDLEDGPEEQLRRHMRRQRLAEQLGRRLALEHEGDDDADLAPPDLGLDEGEGEDDLDQDEDVPEPGFRRTVDGHRGSRLQGDDGRPRRRKRADQDEDEERLGGFDAADLAGQRRQVAREEVERQRLRDRQERQVTAADYERSRRCPAMYGRLEPPQAYTRRGRRRL
jgi:hypothetical protein